jgi:hypothetical protein
VKPEKKLYHLFKKNCPNLLIQSIECYNVAGVPDCLIWTKNGGFAMCELKHTTTNKIKVSCFQHLFLKTRSDLINGKHRNFILVNQAPQGRPRSVILYGANSIDKLITGINNAVPLAVNDWQLIEKIISG